MMDIERILEKIREEKDNLIAKAFTCQISSLLSANGIVPIMIEYRKKELDSITDNSHQLVYKLGVTFDRLDTSKHDKQIKVDVIDDAIHRLDNSKINCHEDYVDGIDYAIGILRNMREWLN